MPQPLLQGAYTPTRAGTGKRNRPAAPPVVIPHDTRRIDNPFTGESSYWQGYREGTKTRLNLQKQFDAGLLSSIPASRIMESYYTRKVTRKLVNMAGPRRERLKTYKVPLACVDTEYQRGIEDALRGKVAQPRNKLA